jgi:hypothetical protein
MRIKVCGRHHHRDVNHELIREACRFYGQLLFITQQELDTINNLSVRIDNVVGLKHSHRCDAYTSYIDGHADPRSFVVEIDAHLDRKATLCTLAHEFAHVRQYSTGIARWSPHGDGVVWYGNHIAYDSMDYYDYPWEVDAYGREVGLYSRFIEKDHAVSDHSDLLRRL